MFFDDNRTNIEAAAAVGMQSVLVSDFDDLTQKIDRINARQGECQPALRISVSVMIKKNRFVLSPTFLDEPVPELERLATSGWQLNRPNLPEGNQQVRMGAIHEPLAEFVAQTIAAGDRPVSLAGDCCTAIGVLAGLQRAGVKPWLLWLDAHGDFNTPETTPSGFLGGMPLAMMVGKGDQSMPAAVGLQPLPEQRVVLADGRDLDPGERQLIQNTAMLHLTDVSDLLTWPLPDGPLYIHFDTDVVALEESPAHNYPAQGGPSVTMLESVFRRLAETGRVIAVSLSAWNPKIDQDRTSEMVSMFLLQALVGDV